LKSTNRPSADAKPFEFKLNNDYPTLYRQGNEQQRLELFSQVSQEENKYREIFAQDRNSTLISDPHVMLIDVHKDYDIFNSEEESQQEKHIPRVFELQRNSATKSPDLGSKPAIVPHKEFLHNFATFTEDSLRYINW
jgi:hypothetical protein